MNPNIEPLERRRLLALAGDIDPTFAPQTYALADHFVPMGNDQFLVLGAQTLQKINAAGTPDASFSLDPGPQGSRVPEEIEDAFIQDDGKIVLAGFPPPLNLPGVVARFNADGTLDTAFAENGFFDPSTLNARYSVESAAPAPGGKMVLDIQQVPDGDSFGGNDPFDTGDQTLHVIRLNADGSVDTSFAPFSFTNHFLATPALVVDSQDRVLIGGNVAFGSTDSVSIVRLRASDGSLDTSFAGGDGAIAEIPTRAIAILPGGNGAFVAVDDNSNVRQFTAAGAADSSFGTAGVATTGIQSSAAVEFPQILPTPGGRWLLFNEQWMTRLNADGSQDSTFPPISDPTEAKEFISAAFDAAGSVLVLRHIVGTDGDELGRLLGAPDANISSPITLSGSTLSITGTADADVIQILASVDKLTASIGALARVFDPTGINLLTVQAGAGNDFVEDSTSVPAVVSGGDGADTIIGGDGDDSLSGNAGRDKIWGGAGNDRVAGNGGRDRLDGGPGDDRVYGGAGNDWLFADDGKDILVGQAGNDVITDTTGHATISGGAGDDTIFAKNSVAQSIFGDDGNDSASHDDSDILQSIENNITS